MQELELEPHAGSLIESLRAFGYTFETAVADLVDNSISAGASEIDVILEDEDDLVVAVMDNGCGMSRDEMLVAMRPGSRSPLETRSMADLGRFGLGLKTASFSQCRKVTVVSRRDAVTTAIAWDLDLVTKRGKWIAVELSTTDSVPLVSNLGEAGTAVIWESIDRISGVELKQGSRDRSHALNEQANSVGDHLQVVFHRFMENERGKPRVRFRLNGRELQPFDPFNRNHPATVFLPEEVIEYAGAKIIVQPVVLPHYSKVDKPTWEKHAGPRGYLRGQGFYLYRNRRLIVDGSWLRLMRQTPLTQLARVQVDIDSSLDHEWRIGVKKDSAELPLVVRTRLKEIIDRIDLQARRPFTKRGTTRASAERFPFWSRVKDGDNISYRISLENPVISEMLSEMSEEQKDAVRHVLTLVSASLPLETIFSDLGTDGSKVTIGEVEASALETGLKAIAGQLVATQLSAKEVRKALLSIEPYRSNSDLSSEILDSVLGRVE